MLYRELGNTKKQTSVIGLGCEHIDGKPFDVVNEVIGEALSFGVNILDVFMPGNEVRGNIAKALGNKRRNVMIQGHIGATDVRQQYDISRDLPNVKKYFEALLKLFGHIDIGMLFFIDSDEDYKNVFETDFVTYAEQLKKNGDILHIGFSSHNPATAKKAIETGVPETVMFSVNPAFDMLPSDKYVFDHMENKYGGEMFRGFDPVRAEFYKICEQKRIGITTMKSLGAGKLLSSSHTPYSKPLTAAQCIHYALSRPAVASVLPGCASGAEVRGVMEYLTATDEEKDYAEVLGGARNDFKGNCLYCSHCQPCPTDIDIASAMKFLDIARLDVKNIPNAARNGYAALKAERCTECGSCESRCPFGVAVTDNLKEANKIFI